MTNQYYYQPAATSEEENYEGWGIVELMGHRKLAGKLSTRKIAGMNFLRLDIPARIDTAVETEYSATQFLNPSSIYALHPTTEDVARAVAAKLSPEPVTTWDVKALMPAQSKTPVAAQTSFIDHFDVDEDEDEDEDDGDDGPF